MSYHSIEMNCFSILISVNKCCLTIQRTGVLPLYDMFYSGMLNEKPTQGVMWQLWRPIRSPSCWGAITVSMIISLFTYLQFPILSGYFIYFSKMIKIARTMFRLLFRAINFAWVCFFFLITPITGEKAGKVVKENVYSNTKHRNQFSLACLWSKAESQLNSGEKIKKGKKKNQVISTFPAFHCYVA